MLLIALFLLLGFTAFSQKTNSEVPIELSFLESRNSQSSFATHLLEKESEEAIQNFIFQNTRIKEQSDGNIIAHYVQQSPAGKHYSFFQSIKGIEVYNSEIKVNTDGKGRVTSFFDNSFSPQNLIDEGASRLHASNLLNEKFHDFSIIKDKAIWFPQSEEVLTKAFLFELQRGASENIEVTTNGDEIFQIRDLNTYLSLPDTTAKGYIFLPDPLTTAGKLYGGNYVDNNDQDAAWLTNQRKEVNLQVEYANQLFHLRNPYVQISDFDAPYHAPATAVLPMFNYTRSNMNFEQVNAFYHITEMAIHIQQMGFNAADSKVDVDANALNGQDNSFFAYNYTPMRLYLGIGGVDDGEDADVIVHEYSHFLSYNAAPQSNIGNERLALDEALGDYNAASYSRFHNDFYWGWVYNWDGHNAFWAGREVNTTKKYPADVVNNIYRDGEIWSSLLMQLWSDIGKDVTDKLIMQAHYGYAQNISFIDASNLLLQADLQLFNNDHYCIITQRLHERGLLSGKKTLCTNSVRETANDLPVFLVQTPEGCIITSAETLWNTTLEVYDALGKKISTQNFEGKTTLTSNHFAQGIYFVKLHNGTASKTLKWLNMP